MLHISVSSRRRQVDFVWLDSFAIEGTHTLGFLSLSVELSLEWLCIVELNDGDGIGEVQELVDVGVPPVSLLLLLSVVADEGIPTPDNSTSSRPIMSS